MIRRSVRKVADGVEASDVVVVGSGLAGLTAALALAPRRVTLLTKTELCAGGSSSWAQGGVAAALDRGDSPRAHAEDTLLAGVGLSDAEAVAVLTAEGPQRVLELAALGARFDRDARGRLALGREGAHRRRRIVHARGDQTGDEMVRVLVRGLRAAEHVQVREHTFVHDLVLDDHGAVIGVVAGGGQDGERPVFYRSAAVVLASGGFGRVYARTTNPPAVTGDGLAMAARAGAELAELEFVQFHPTALDVASDPLPLVSEAVRGEGAVLLDDLGERFMVGTHERAELAPRDVVARAIYERQEGGRQVVLDARAYLGEAFDERFPAVAAHCRRYGVDPRRQPIPVTPAAHYTMGGVAVDAWGRASLKGLWACGEVAASGVHGANRLASNSLLEALVFGKRVARDVNSTIGGLRVVGARFGDARPLAAGSVWREERAPAGAALEVCRRVRELMWRRVGLVRDRFGLETALAELEAMGPTPGGSVLPAEARNLLTVARLVAAAALDREESRGAHFRADFPDPRPELAARKRWIYQDTIGGLPLAPASVPAAREIA